jgi:hypothetical protein
MTLRASYRFSRTGSIVASRGEAVRESGSSRRLPAEKPPKIDHFGADPGKMIVNGTLRRSLDTGVQLTIDRGK